MIAGNADTALLSPLCELENFGIKCLAQLMNDMGLNSPPNESEPDK